MEEKVSHLQESKEDQNIPTLKTEQQHKICEFYVARKRRQCKFQAVKGSKFCASHCSDQGDKIECPYEKGMFIEASKFEKHLLVCPRIRDKKQEEQEMWFNKGVNLSKPENAIETNNINAVVDIEVPLLMSIVHKAVRIFRESFGEKAISKIWSTAEEKIDNLTNDHIQAHLLAEAAFNVGLIKDDIIYLEFGAGKGILSYHLAERVKKECKKMSKNVLLEREPRRNKFDRFMKDNPYFQRYKIDVSDFDVQKLAETMSETAKIKSPTLDTKKEAAELNELQIVGVCKHMCGGALDISLRALLKTKMSGCILASCCHHLCSYDTYLNNKFFESRSLTPDEIQILFRISAWGTKSTLIENEEIDLEKLEKIEHSELNGNSRILIGRMCKRLIDLGRAEFLECDLVRYCSDQITPENFVIITK